MLTERLQAAIDREVAGSPRARELLQLLDGQSMTVEARYTPWRMTLHALPGRLLLEKGSAADADARLSGTPLALAALARENPAEVIRRGDVSIDGDGQVAERFQQLLQLLRPDLEEALSGLIGDVPAQGVGKLLRMAVGYGRDSLHTVARNVGEYVAHERGELVASAEAQEFLDEVDRLRERADRLAVRVDALERHS
ncbi:MAG: SCP2 sterol-binding domain-containing protein [Steroidobacteraceae bacterium]